MIQSLLYLAAFSISGFIIYLLYRLVRSVEKMTDRSK